MKNCRRKLRGVVRGSLWNDAEFDRRLRGITSRAGRKAAISQGDTSVADEPFVPVLTDDDWNHAWKVLDEFATMEPEFVKYLNDDNNWEMFDSDV
jgi:hypothetical protein